MRWNDNGTIRDNLSNIDKVTVEDAARMIDGVAGVLLRYANSHDGTSALDAQMCDMLASVLLDSSATVAQFVGAAKPAPQP